MATFTEGHAVVIGVGTYKDAQWNAPVTVADAQGVAEALNDPAVGGYPAEQVTLLRDAETTREGVTAALKGLAERAKADATAVIFFCGHGAPGTDGEYHFGTHEAVFTNSRIEAGTGLRKSELLDLLRSIKVQKLLFIINACFSGSVGPTLGAGGVLGAPPSTMLGVEILSTGEGRALLMASRSSQYSYYSRQQQHTLFGQALIDALRGRGSDANGGHVGLFELYEQVYRDVGAAAAAMNALQEPVLTLMEGVGPFPIARLAGATGASLSPAALRQDPPRGLAAEVVERATVQAVGQAAQAINFQNVGTASVERNRNVLDFGRGNTMGNVTIGNVAGRDMITVTTTYTPGAAAGVDSKQELLDMIGKLRQEVADLRELPEDERDDLAEELEKAKKAGDEGKGPRMREKLEAAQKILVGIGASVPAAVKLAETVGTLLQRAMGMFA